MAVISKERQITVRDFELDGAGIIYAVTNKKNWNRVYRVAAVMKKDVQPDILARAITDLRDRFPTFFVQLDTDFFNYKLKAVGDTDVLCEEDAYPCGHIVAGSGKKPMFRVKYFRNRISLEVFHILSDGGGAMCFLKNIVARYLELQGCKVEKAEGVLDLDSAFTDAEIEDSYKKVRCVEKSLSRSEPFAYQYRQPRKDNFFMLTHGFFRVDDIKPLTKAKGVTVTEYLAAVYTRAFYETMPPYKNKKPIKLSVPVDLRRLFDSATLRSFSLYVNTCVYPGRQYSFDDILAEVTGQMREGLQKDNLGVRVVKNTAAQNSPVFRYTPLFMKKTLLNLGYVFFGEKAMTSAFTNLGIIHVPKGMAEHLDHFDFVAAGTLNTYVNCAVSACNGVINVVFSSRSEATDVQRSFFTFLASKGIPVCVQSNVKQKAADSAEMRRCCDCGVEYKGNHDCCPLCSGYTFSAGKLQPLVTVPYPELG